MRPHDSRRAQNTKTLSQYIGQTTFRLQLGERVIILRRRSSLFRHDARRGATIYADRRNIDKTGLRWCGLRQIFRGYDVRTPPVLKRHATSMRQPSGMNHRIKSIQPDRGRRQIAGYKWLNAFGQRGVMTNASRYGMSGLHQRLTDCATDKTVCPGNKNTRQTVQSPTLLP